MVHPQGLEVLAWRIGDETPEFLPVSTLTVRDYDGPGVTVHLRDGAAAVTATNDHPFVVFDEVEGTRIVLGGELSEGMRVPRVVSAPLRIDPIPGLGGPTSLAAGAAGAARRLGVGDASGGAATWRDPSTRWRCRRRARS